jgi:hypothetical protein
LLPKVGGINDIKSERQMSFLKAALDLAAQGFHVFPLIPYGKTPLIDDFPHRATRDSVQIKQWWLDPVLEMEQPFNIGISTTRFGDNEALLVVDVDNKGDKKGDEEIVRLEIKGCEFPTTLTQCTPTGGKHFIYRTAKPVKQGSDVLGRGLDIRSRGGYIVGAGSVTERGTYSAVSSGIEWAPEWLVSDFSYSTEREPAEAPTYDGVDEARATTRAIRYLENEAAVAEEGSSGDQTTYLVACCVKDLGVSETACFELMASHWNERCSPPWSSDELQDKVHNAYKYGVQPVGVSSPEVQFDPVNSPAEKEILHPIQELNKEFAFVLAGGGSHILWETKDHRGFYKLEHLSIQSFHQKLASKLMYIADGKARSTSELWMKSPDRRGYDGICFMPGKKAPERFYNLWRGFSVEPLTSKPTPEAKHAVDMFLEHALKNVCRGDKILFHWLIGYFAHLIQRPWEKPLVALVFRGSKGVGKNALVDCVGSLLGNHYLLTSNRRYLVGNFNGHMENLLLFALDEAFWSGDKQAEGTLKDLITGKTHVVEHKGKEPYSVENCTRVVIIGNEEWLVPATQDERRFAVFDVGDGRKQDRTFFQTMREGMERGGYRLLLRYLLDFDTAGTDANAAPNTEGLLDQKLSSLGPFHQWWLDCLTEGAIVNADFSGGWSKEVDKDRFRSAFRRYIKERQIRSRIPEDRAIGRLLKQCLPSTDAANKRREGTELINVYRIPDLEQSRREWEKFIGHPVAWDHKL